jgi:hypothetical protein
MGGGPQSTRRRSVARSAIDNVLHRISALPPSPLADSLRSQAEAYMRETDDWTAASPSVQEKERLMKAVLKLHVEVAKLEK